MGRPQSTEPIVYKCVSVRKSVVEKVELMLYDSLREKVKYGAFSQLCNQLLEAYADGKIDLQALK